MAAKLQAFASFKRTGKGIEIDLDPSDSETEANKSTCIKLIEELSTEYSLNELRTGIRPLEVEDAYDRATSDSEEYDVFAETVLADRSTEATIAQCNDAVEMFKRPICLPDPNHRLAANHRLAELLFESSSARPEAPPQAYVLSRAILDRRWKQINNISKTIHNDTKQYNTIYHIIHKTGEKQSRLHSSAHVLSSLQANA